MVFKCDLCNIELGSDAQFKQHLDGKKHKRLESIKEERQKSSLRSLFVSGLKKDVFVKHLEEHFQQYGKICKIIIDKDKKAYAIVEFENENSVEAALKDAEHKVNNKLVKVKRRMTKEFVSKMANHSEKKKEALEKSKQELMAINAFLPKCKNFDEQVQKFIDYSQISEQELANRQQICSELNATLKKYLENSSVCIFGSTATGLATNGSDMDVTVLLDSYLESNKNKQQKLPKKGSLKTQTSSDNSLENGENGNAASIEIDIVEEEEEEYLSESQFEDKCKNLLSLELEEQISIVTKLLQRYAVDLQDIRKVTNSRCPVIRFDHENFKVSCDITLNNYLAVENTRLINLLLELDPTLKCLVYVIRYWSKQKGLNGTFKFNSYTLIWLIVFYLQKIERLPTVDFLAKLAQSERLIHGWNVSFESNVEKVRKEFKPKNVEELSSFSSLLNGFFEFYSKFQFDANSVLSTRSGKIESCDGSKISKKSVINVQDPFDLEHNLSANINDTVLERFKTECQQACNVLKCCLTPHKPNENQTPKYWGLSMLFTRKTPELITPREHANNCLENGVRIKLNLNNNDYDKNVLGIKETEFAMSLLASCLLFEVKREEVSNENIELKQRKRIPAMNQICTKVDSLGLNSSPKRLRVSDDAEKYFCMEEIQNNKQADEDEDEFKCYESLKHLASYSVAVRKNTWQGRRNVKRELLKQQQNEESLELEKQTSLKLAEENQTKAQVNQEEIDFKMSAYLLAHYNDFYLNLKFTLGEPAESLKMMNFTTLIHFLDTYLNNSFAKYYETAVKSAAKST